VSKTLGKGPNTLGKEKKIKKTKKIERKLFFLGKGSSTFFFSAFFYKISGTKI
jgi:hypothetical protein